MQRRVLNVKLEPGDCLLYGPTSIMGWVIAVKTWTMISHVEVYRGSGTSWASRDGVGVNLYPLRTTGLRYVRRPAKYEADVAEEYGQACRGQRYDWLGLLCFTLAVRQGSKDRQFCSEFALNLYRRAGVEVLSPDCLPDHTAPSEFLQTPALTTVWRAK